MIGDAFSAEAVALHRANLHDLPGARGVALERVQHRIIEDDGSKITSGPSLAPGLDRGRDPWRVTSRVVVLGIAEASCSDPIRLSRRRIATLALAGAGERRMLAR